MKLPMRTFLMISLLAGLTASLGAQELPAAPSSAGKTAAAPAPAPAPAQTAASANETPKPVPVAAAKPAAPPPSVNDDVPDTGTIIRKRVDEVNVIFTVTDKGGHFIKGLKQDDFSVLDDKRPPQSMVAFRSETNLPLRAALLIDSSNSIRDRFSFELDASAEFLSQTIRPKVDKAIVYGFDATPDPV